MGTFILTTLPEKCWIFSKGRYLLKGTSLPKLPWVRAKYECILKAYGIPYRKLKKNVDCFSTNVEVCEYWNPEFGLKEMEISLPLFAAIGDSYQYCEKKYSEKAPSNETIASAMKIQKFVEDEIDNYEQILRDVYLYQLAKECISGNIAQMSRNLKPYLNLINEEIEMNHDKFKILSLIGMNWVAIFDMNKIAPNSYVTLKVPKDIAGYVIGRNGRNIQHWAEEIGVKQIRVIPI